MSDKVEFNYTKEDLYRDFIKKLNSLGTNREEANKPASNLRSTAQSIREKIASTLGTKSK